MKVYAITVAFCPAVQLARSLMEFSFCNALIDKHIVVQGHYPINREKNNRDIKMIVDSYREAELWDPGSNLGSAQSQWWALQQLDKDSYWVNVDPDSHCGDSYSFWIHLAKSFLDKDPNCVVISCWSKMWQKFIEERRYTPLKHLDLDTPVFSFENPVPFNLSMWRTSFLHDIGGIPQMGEMWGEVEGPLHHEAKRRGKYHAYLMDYIEDESGKYMQDRQLLEFKDLNMRTAGPNRFYGRFNEYLKWKYPEIVKLDTYIPENTVFQ